MANKWMLAIVSASLLTLLSGCEEPLTLAKVCEETPGFCNDLNKDSHCKEERASVIIGRYVEYKDPTDENKYQLLKQFESYNSCVSLAAQIEHIKLKEKTTSRVEGHLTSLKEMNRIYQDTKQTSHPGLLYYHWSRNNSQYAMNKLLRQEDEPYVRQSQEIQMFLATYYAKFDDDKTIDFLYRVLELNQAGETPDLEVYKALVSIFYKQKKYKHAYTFARIAQLSGFEEIDIIDIEHELTSRGRSIGVLNQLALKTREEIETGQFLSPRG
ncbi:DUF2989 domain-containing protein [Pseudoalteromonas luteoviolacea]|uniref:DUF2989 domain-containing protein n=1 Tax=Pseudoalteromonas luteoviolacea H33 TaxID=1365251 RepID=A0A167E700_9GAMM|nr:DUF2989 domain-containing protein [Pseudoalteromonas luteoviolacea]KZN50142.1 hypothetical protein N476_17495 [Pseudoalteromonas luteoviolacea H33]KZN76285.1 hypothetical protein N477_16395 [Pseudoalteromonas luteoviolacea H33-S]MBQ4880172.1 DUF2989 domain-containing protein [Pseudoalteromonas luteoviolacea]MBQ4909233.1 DUF2989 domain-containing protein [Pseudoalteromonas luteoviolacea]MCF6442370.1 DUF2989 domain-containing protein [Pseudoalteromonas luteoviolacea]